MFRLVLAIFLSYLILVNSSLANSDSLLKVKGICQNLVINGNDWTKECANEIQRIDFENGRINYWFSVPNRGIIIFAGSNEQSNPGDLFFSRFQVDTVYVNKKEFKIDGSCSTLGRRELGVTISCRSSDNARLFSSLFITLSGGKKQ